MNEALYIYIYILCNVEGACYIYLVTFEVEGRNVNIYSERSEKKLREGEKV